MAIARAERASRHVAARFLVAAALIVCTSGSAAAQRNNMGACQFSYDERGYFVSPFWYENPIYSGQITFARIKYRGSFMCADEGPGWAHDFPRMESNFLRIFREISATRPVLKEKPLIVSTLLALDDPELFRYPVAYLSEPGGWDMTETEVKGLRKFMTRGGFMIIDDMGFRGRNDVPNLMYQWRRAFPKAEMLELKPDHPVFSSFFNINFAAVQGSYGPPLFYAFFEDNNPKKRLLAVINANNDLGEWIEFSDQGFDPTPTNESYKLMVNYFIYALTH
jgi:hypothetical protein